MCAHMGDKGGTRRQGGDKCKLMRPKAPRVGDKGETSVNSCGPRHAEWETRRPKEPRVGDMCFGDRCGRQVGDKCKLMRPRHPEWETRGDKCKLMRPKKPRVGDKGETSVNSCGPRNPEWRQVWGTSVGDKCKLMRPKAPRVGDKGVTRGGQV